MNAESQIKNIIEEFGIRTVLAVLADYVDQEIAESEKRGSIGQPTLCLIEAKPHLEQACRELDA